jgi:hypothetical protein
LKGVRALVTPVVLHVQDDNSPPRQQSLWHQSDEYPADCARDFAHVAHQACL